MPGNVAKGFGDRVRHTRLERKLGLRELARRTELSPATLSRIENGGGDKHPSAAVVAALSHELGVDPTWLLYGEAGIGLESRGAEQIRHVADALGYDECARRVATAALEVQDPHKLLSEEQATALLARADLFCRELTRIVD